MNKKYALIIDDHPLIANAYKQALKKVAAEMDIEIEVNILNTIDEVVYKMEDEEFFSKQELILLDIRLPISSDSKYLSGEDLGGVIREKFPDIKLAIATTFNDNYRIHSILKNVDPEGFLVKNDLTPDELTKALRVLLTDPPFYSITVLKMLRKQIKDEAFLDHLDRRLLYELSIGTKMKDLPEIIPLSKAGIERRKRNLKLIFNVENQSDRDLIQQAQQRGFI